MISRPSWRRARSTCHDRVQRSSPIGLSGVRIYGSICGRGSPIVVITLGYDMVEYHPRSCGTRRGSKKIIHLDFLPAEIDEHYRGRARCRRRPRAYALDVERARSTRRPHTWELLEYQRNCPIRRMNSEVLRALHKDDDHRRAPSGRRRRSVGCASRCSDAKDVLLSDVGAHKMWIAPLLPVPTNRTRA